MFWARVLGHDVVSEADRIRSKVSLTGQFASLDEDLTGKLAQEVLDGGGVTLNRNSIPGDTRSPFVTSGLRIGTASVTTQGMGTDEMVRIAGFIAQILRSRDDQSVVVAVRAEIAAMCAGFPPYEA